MIQLQAGDILLARGRKFQHKLSRFFLGYEWNHMAVLSDANTVIELTWSDGVVSKPIARYLDKQIAILRKTDIEECPDCFSFLNGMICELGFDFVGFIKRCLRLPPGRQDGKIVCHKFVELVYQMAEYDLDSEAIMRGISATALSDNNLVKIYDYRDE